MPASTRILVVEDEQIVARDIQRTLQGLGYDVPEIAATGSDAVRLADELRPDLVLMDIRLRGPMDGIVAASIIHDRWDIPVVYLTAHADPGTLQRAKIAEPFGYVLKPFDQRDLHTTIEMALYKHRIDRQLRESQKWLTVTLNSIGDAVIATDQQGQVVFINPVAQSLTGWKADEAVGRPLNEIFRIINEHTRHPVENPVARVLSSGLTVGLGNHTLLVARDGTERPIDDSAAPIRNDRNEVLGVVLVFRDVTERRRAENALRRSERELADFFETASVGLHWVGPDGTILRVNQAELDMLGYSREEYVGHHIAEFHPDQDVIADVLCRLQRGERLQDYPARMKCKDGSLRECLIDSSVLWEDGRFVHTRCFTRDVTERKRAEEAVRDRERQLQVVTDTVAVLIAHCDSERRFKFVNKPYAERFGLHPRDLIGRSIPEVLGEEAFAVIAPYIDLALAGQRVEFEAEVPYQGIGTECVLCAYEPEIDSAGRVVGYIAAITNISERKRMERALAEEARTNETLYRIGRTLAAEHDLQEIVQTVTDEATSATGAQFGAFFYNVVTEQGEAYTLYTLAGAPREAFAGFPMPRNTDIFEPTFQGRGTVRLDDVTQDPRYGKNAPHFGMPDGHLPVRSYLAVPVVSRSGEVLGGLFFGHAQSGVFTERHERLVEGIASQAAVAIDNARLYGSLNESDRRKDEFLALLGHELRNPLATVVNGVQILQSHGSADEKVAHVQKLIERQSRHMTHLIDDLLDVTRISRGKIGLRKQRLDLVELARKTIEDHQPTLDESGCEIDVRLPKRKLWIDADPTRIHQLLGNLLQNAFKFTDPGGRITVELRTDSEQREALVSIRDTGIGMTRETIDRLFIPFSQADKGLERNRGGLGLGLALVKGLVELHGGTIRADSPGEYQGSEFTVALPLALDASPAREESRTQASQASPRALRALVVEDSAPVAEIFAMMLQEMGHDVEFVASGEEALQRIPVYRPQIVFSDISMPRMSGYELARRIREQVDFSELVLVAMTGYGQPDDRNRALQAGFDHHLVKPADLDQLRALFATIAKGA